MLFNSFQFVFFFGIVTFLYFVLPHRYRWSLLLAASCYFYMAFVPVYILILGFTIVIDYYAGIRIERTSGKRRKLFLLMSLVANIGVLAAFKYYNFLNDILTSLLQGVGKPNPVPYLSILLPIGLSFHTFQAMSYTIEVYRGRQPAERNFGVYALYVMFYPQLVAGPIERPQNLLHQFYEKHTFDSHRLTEGLKLMLWGFFKKIVIADRLAIYVNAAYNNAAHHNGTTLLVATVFFTFQIYCDFSGYSDIAIGAAHVMGFRLMTNFRRPYLARNIAEFWQRWHISLSTWFKDYVYIPLGGNRVRMTRWYFNLFVVFLISGLWHGANWTFIVWGAINGFYLVFAMVTAKARGKLTQAFGLDKLPHLFTVLQVCTTFVLASFAWIFFRANHLSDAFLIIRKIVTSPGPVYASSPTMLIFSALGILFLLMVELKQEFYRGNFYFFGHSTWLVRNLSYAFLILLILLMGVYDGGQFIYFQF